jgi:hypothetical protein
MKSYERTSGASNRTLKLMVASILTALEGKENSNEDNKGDTSPLLLLHPNLKYEF